MKRIILAAAMAFLLSACAEDYDPGLDAYNAGDYETAYEIWRPLAEQGDAEAQNSLGLMYEKGLGVEQDDVEAVRLYKLAAEQDHAVAMNNLGDMYFYEQGVEQDDVEAVRLYKLAAEQGHATAMYNLGWMYRHGRGVQQDYVEAVRLYKLAAEQDHAVAMNNLGVMYDHGRGVEQDLDTAKMWYELAVENGNETAKSNLSNLLQLPEMKRKLAPKHEEIFTKNPSISPILVRRDGRKYWSCSATIHEIFLKELFSAVRTVANEENMPPPLSSLCTYSRYELDLFGSKSQEYVVNWYVSEASRRACIRDSCHHFRSANFKYIDGKLHADIFLTRVATQQVRHACYNVEEKRFRYRNKGCMH